MIYFVTWQGDESAVKIGWTDNSDGRLRSYATYHWRTLVVHARKLGDEDEEQRLHEQFRDHQVHREWFRAEPVLAFILPLREAWEAEIAADLRAGCGDAIRKLESPVGASKQPRPQVIRIRARSGRISFREIAGALGWKTCGPVARFISRTPELAETLESCEPIDHSSLDRATWNAWLAKGQEAK